MKKKYLKLIIKKRQKLYLNSYAANDLCIERRVVLSNLLKGWFVQNLEGHLAIKRSNLKLYNKGLQIEYLTLQCNPLLCYIYN